jgi:hypothetical protein
MSRFNDIAEKTGDFLSQFVQSAFLARTTINMQCDETFLDYMQALTVSKEGMKLDRFYKLVALMRAELKKNIINGHEDKFDKYFDEMVEHSPVLASIRAVKK